MKAGATFSGFPNIIFEDVAVNESMGTISDRTREHLVPSDAAIVRARRLYIRNARKVVSGEYPVALSFATCPTPGEGLVSESRPWRSWFQDEKTSPEAMADRA
jgi:hypothetical protein